MFRFTGKELDQETGLYYYGARYLDPKTSRWISADPAMGEYVPSPGQRKSRLPGLGGIYNIVNMHVYAYTHNNPINLTDPDGKFPIDMHAEMVIIAFGGMIISTVAMDLLKMGASSVADIGYINIASVHMDNMTGTSSIKTFYLDTKNDFETFMENGNYIMAGVTLHTIADFYSHSNYISLYKQYAEQNGLPMDINKIPTFLEALQNSDLMKFIEDNGGLKTGTFRFWNPWSSNLESHNKMNLDKNKGKGAEIYNRDDRSTMHDAARATAQKDLNKIVQDWYNK
jgi:RHS repeat-associated protein